MATVELADSRQPSDLARSLVGLMRRAGLDAEQRRALLDGGMSAAVFRYLVERVQRRQAEGIESVRTPAQAKRLLAAKRIGP